jgi:hypothetical protein
MLDFIMMLFDVGHEELGMSERRAVSGWNLIGLAMLALAPGVVLYLVGFESPDPIRALLYGITIIGAAFVLSWAAEVVQMDFSQSLALALLALIAILPEYIVDATFAWLAAEDPAYAGYPVANMISKYKHSLTRMLIKDIPRVIVLAFFLISLVLGVALAIAMLGKLLPVR